MSKERQLGQKEGNITTENVGPTRVTSQIIFQTTLLNQWIIFNILYLNSRVLKFIFRPLWHIFVILEITHLSLCRWISKAISQDRYPSDGKGSYLPLACQNAEAGSALELNISHTSYLLQVFRIIFLPHKVVFILLFCKITEFINDWLLS